MNIYFINPQYIRPQDIPYLLGVLNIKRIYSYIPKEELPQEMVALFPKQIKASFCEDLNKQENFFKTTTISICNNIAPTKKGLNGFIRQDLDKGINSKPNTPLQNISLSDDFNAIIFATCKSWIGKKGNVNVPRFNFDKSCPYFKAQKDIATETSRFCLNLLNKQLKTSKYSDRICFIRFDEFLVRSFYFIDGEWREFNYKSNKGITIYFFSRISKLLSQHYSNIFPIITENNFYPTKEAYFEYRKFTNEAKERRLDYYNMNRSCFQRNENDSNNYYLDAYGDSMTDEEYNDYRNNLSNNW